MYNIICGGEEITLDGRGGERARRLRAAEESASEFRRLYSSNLPARMLFAQVRFIAIYSDTEQPLSAEIKKELLATFKNARIQIKGPYTETLTAFVIADEFNEERDNICRNKVMEIIKNQ